MNTTNPLPATSRLAKAAAQLLNVPEVRKAAANWATDELIELREALDSPYSVRPTTHQGGSGGDSERIKALEGALRSLLGEYETVSELPLEGRLSIKAERARKLLAP